MRLPVEARRGYPPLHPDLLFLVAPKERRQRNALNASRGLGPAGQTVHCSSFDQPVRRRAKFRGAKVAGVPAPHTTERYGSQAASTGRQRAKARQATQAPQAPGFCSLFVAESPCSASLVCGAGTPATLAPQVFALPERAGGRMSDAPPAPDGPRPPEALSAFLWFLSLAQQRKELARRGEIPAGCTAHHQSQRQSQ
jgi:hypothetical protein